MRDLDDDNDDADTSPYRCKCGKPINKHRYELGYTVCMSRECAPPPPTRTVAPMHKSNLVLVTDLRDLKGINNKGGFYR